MQLGGALVIPSLVVMCRKRGIVCRCDAPNIEASIAMWARFLIVSTAALVMHIGIAMGSDSVRDEVLRRELLEMTRIDQDARNQRDAKIMLAVDTRNTSRLKDIVAKHGWPTISLVGEDGARAAWLLAQHADADPSFQLEVLQLMEPLLAKKEADGKLFAYLFDRTHKPQRYGTQGSCSGSGVWSPREIEDAPNVDKRRATVGMVPEKLADYAQFVGRNACK